MCHTRVPNTSCLQVSNSTKSHFFKPCFASILKWHKSLQINFICCSFEELKNRIVVHTIESLESCTHEVACPPGQPYIPLQPRRTEPAKKYPFTLDPFQQESVLCIDNNQSVLVSAHTSAGKTVVAE